MAEREDRYQDNQLGGAGIALLVGAAAVLGWLIFARRSPIAPAAAATCAVDPQKLDRWGRARGFPVVYLPQATTIPSFDTFVDLIREKYPGIGDVADIDWKQFVAVISDGSFWYYQIAADGDAVNTGRADNLRADYCAFEG
jgi:hypothetical protein